MKVEHLVVCSLIFNHSSPYDEVIIDVINDMLSLHYKEDLKCVLENVNLDGSILDNPTGRTINPGHTIENSWFLMNYSQLIGDKTLLTKALNMLKWSLELGWDKEFGGVKYFVDVYNRPCEQLEHDMKLWWVHNECLIATLYAHFITGEKIYEEWYDKIHEYVFNRFPDKEFGEWYGYLHRDGTVSHTQKGSLWKGPYHLPRCLILCEQILIAMEKNFVSPELL